MSKAKDKVPSDGYFRAKREVQDSLDGRIGILNRKLKELKTTNYLMIDVVLMEEEIRIMEKVRSHLRNSLLWDTGNGR